MGWSSNSLSLNNLDFDYIKLDGITNQSESNSFSLTPKHSIESICGIGLVSKSSRYGGAFAHRDLAFELALS